MSWEHWEDVWPECSGREQDTVVRGWLGVRWGPGARMIPEEGLAVRMAEG